MIGGDGIGEGEDRALLERVGDQGIQVPTMVTSERGNSPRGDISNFLQETPVVAT